MAGRAEQSGAGGRAYLGRLAAALTDPERLWLNLKADTRIGLQKAAAGQSPRIEHFCIKVRPFDRDAVTAGLKKIGAEVLTSADEPGIVRFLDNNRIMVELKPGV